MGREFRIFLVTIAGVVLLFFGLTAVLPQEWTIETTASMPAPREKVAPMFADFNGWKRWSAIQSTGRTDTTLAIDGEPGKVGHQLSWRSGPSEAVFRVADVRPDGVDITFLSRMQPGSPLVDYGQSRIRVQPEGTGCRVTWSESGRVDGILGRWFIWFGVQQKTQQQFHEASLSGIRVELEGK